MTATTASWGVQTQYLFGSKKVLNRGDKTEDQLYGVVRAINIAAQYFLGSSGVGGPKNLTKLVFTAFDWARFYKFPSYTSPAFEGIAAACRTAKNVLGTLEAFKGEELLKPLSERDIWTGNPAGLGEKVFKKASQVATWVIGACDAGMFFNGHKCFHLGGRIDTLINRVTPWGYFIAGNVSGLRGLYEVAARVVTGKKIEPNGNNTKNTDYKDPWLTTFETVLYTSILGLTWILASPGITGFKFDEKTAKFWQHAFYSGTIAGSLLTHFWKKIALREPV